MKAKDRGVFELVYEAVTRGYKVEVGGSTLTEAIKVASLNKVLLQFLRALEIGGPIRFREEARFKRFVDTLTKIVESLKGLEYSFIKLSKPVLYVPSDVDILVRRSSLKDVISRLRREGFRVEVVEAYCVTMRSRRAIVDVYLYPTLGGVIYIDSEKLLEHVRPITFEGLELPSLAPYAEALLSASHAIYKERIYTLNDYVTVDKWLSPKSLKLAESARCEGALSLAWLINELVKGGRLTLPYRLPLHLWALLLSRKYLSDSLTRGSVKGLLRALGDRRIGKQVISKLTRSSY